MPRKKNSDLATHETKNIHLEKDHAGRDVWTLRKRFPDGYTLRRRMPRDSAAKLLKRIETAIDYGPEGPRGWKELKKELNHETNSGAKAIPRMTVSSLADLYFNEYCITHHDKETQDFKRQHLDKIKELVGDKLIATFTMDDGEYVKRERLKQKIANSEKRKDETVSPNTVHKTHRVLCHMFNWASDPKYGKEYLVKNPVAGMKSLKQRRYQRQDLPPEDWAQILEAAYAIDHFKATFIALCGELAVRPWAEGITLKRRLFDMRPRVNPRDERWLMIEPSKHDPEGRRIPLSDEAIALARSLPVVVGSEYLFTNPDGTLLSRGQVERVMFEAERITGITWPRMYDLSRHFRATTWSSTGVPLVNVQKWLGHKKIQTTMKYARAVDDQRHLREAKQAESKRLQEPERKEDQAGDIVATA